MVTFEAVIARGGDADAVRRQIKAELAQRFGIDHATVEVCVEPGPGDAPLPATGCAPI